MWQACGLGSLQVHGGGHLPGAVRVEGRRGQKALWHWLIFLAASRPSGGGRSQTLLLGRPRSRGLFLLPSKPDLPCPLLLQRVGPGRGPASLSLQAIEATCVWWSREGLFAVRALKLPVVASFRVFAARNAGACSLCAACQPFCETVFGGGVLRLLVRQPLQGARHSLMRLGGGAKPFSAAARLAVQGAVGPRLQAHCRLALSG